MKRKGYIVKFVIFAAIAAALYFTGGFTGSLGTKVDLSWANISRILLMADAASPALACNAQSMRTRHSSGFNALMLDGHVEYYQGRVSGEHTVSELPSPHKYYFKAYETLNAVFLLCHCYSPFALHSNLWSARTKNLNALIR